MKKQATIIAGQVMQYRDKLYAKRHQIPTELVARWRELSRQADALQPKVDRKTKIKSISFKGTVNDLKTLLSSMAKLYKTLPH